MSPRLSRDWASLVADHSAAVDEFIAAGRGFSRVTWMSPLASGKWSPAEVAGHVTQSYDVLRSELGGGTGMGLRASYLQRWVLRHFMLPPILRGRPFPPGARAPRETRPRELEESPETALAAVSSGAEAFVQELTTRAAAGRVRLTHAYFGPLSPRQSLQLMAVHTRHHARQLAGKVSHGSRAWQEDRS